MSRKIINFFFRNESAPQTIAKNAFWIAASQFGSRLLRASIIIYAARVLGAADYGIFSYALGFAGLFTLAADLGLNPVVIRGTAQHLPDEKDRFATAFWMKCGLIAATAAIVIFAAPVLVKIEAARRFMPAVALLVAFDALREFFIARFRGDERMEREAAAVMATNFAIAVFCFYVLKNQMGVTPLMWTYVLSAGLGTIAGFLLLTRDVIRALRKIKIRLVLPILKAALPLTFLSMMGIFMVNTDLVMIGWWRTPAEVGYYSASQKIIQLLYTLSAVFASSVFPTIARSVKAGDNARVKVIMEKAMAHVLALALPLTFWSIAVGGPTLRFIFGEEYGPGALTFRILAVTFTLQFAWNLIANLIFAYDAQRRVIRGLTLGILANIGLNALLIPRWGIEGAAIATIGSQLVCIGATWKTVRRLNGFRIFRPAAKIAAAAVIMGGSAWILNWAGLGLIPMVLASAGVYIAALLAMQEPILLKILARVSKKSPVLE